MKTASKTDKTRQGDDLAIAYFAFEVLWVTFAERGKCLGNVGIKCNGFLFSLGIMLGEDNHMWVAWPSRTSRYGRHHATLWPESEELRYRIETRVLNAFQLKQLEKFNLK